VRNPVGMGRVCDPLGQRTCRVGGARRSEHRTVQVSLVSVLRFAPRSYIFILCKRSRGTSVRRLVQVSEVEQDELLACSSLSGGG
jgi:hypothetical protein